VRCSRFDGNTDLSTTVHGLVLDLSVGSVNGGLPAKGTANLAKPQTTAAMLSWR
jgi:hypothetical protein